MLDYNVPGGKLNRGMAVLDVLNALKNSVRAFSLSMQLRAQMNPRLTSCSNAAVNTGSLIMGCVFLYRNTYILHCWTTHPLQTY